MLATSHFFEFLLGGRHFGCVTVVNLRIPLQHDYEGILRFATETHSKSIPTNKISKNIEVSNDDFFYNPFFHQKLQVFSCGSGPSTVVPFAVPCAMLPPLEIADLATVIQSGSIATGAP